MSSETRAAINQENAQSSTGPRSEAGKAASSQNARKHGLASDTIVILPGEEDEFTTLRDGLEDQFQPLGAYEMLLCGHILAAAWKMHRCDRAEVEVYRQNPEIDPMMDAAGEPKLRNIRLYHGRAERSFHKSIQELRAVQTERHYREEEDPVTVQNPDPPLQQASPLPQYHKIIPILLQQRHKLAAAREKEFRITMASIQSDLPRNTQSEQQAA